ncbi:GNAT family N-acetyltransferase [Nonomuraea zeae]|uniref:GNAT family N-acetyltransferase n=2 Tax=Nonomuraea zeae TaxID=1642303 RepID=UPI0036063D0D
MRWDDVCGGTVGLIEVRVVACVNGVMSGYGEASAKAAGVVIRELQEIAEFQQVYRLFDEIWHPDPRNVPVTMELMIGFAHTGSYVAGAFEGDVLVGASVGFLAARRTLHSHVTGAVIGRGIGYALKSHQRDWCLDRGLERITWTFDPLVRRNARFNLVKLGAMPEEYLEDFYGAMADAINEGDASDRLLAVWRLAGEGEAGRPGGVDAAGARVVLAEGAGGWPDMGAKRAGDVVLVGTPADVERLRRVDPAAGRAWRRAVREQLGGLMKAGGQVVGFTDRGEYVVVIN